MVTMPAMAIPNLSLKGIGVIDNSRYNGNINELDLIPEAVVV